jgi:hypothetical protein
MMAMGQAMEAYLRVQVADGEDPIEVQGDLGNLKGYIGSYVVETESIGSGDYFPFHIAIGYNGTPDDVDAAIEAIINDPRVTAVRQIRNRIPVSSTILLPDR